MDNNYINLFNQYLTYKQLIALITPFILPTIINSKNYNNIITYKDSIPTKKISIEEKPNIIPNKTNINTLNSYDKYLVNTFTNTLEKHFNPKYLSILYYNLQDLQILNIDKLKNLNITLRKNTTATYDSINNTIYLNNYKTSTIFHELFHVSSSYCDEETNIIYSGFSQINNKHSYGKGLTEGYTQKLTEKYFGTKYNILKSYPYEKGISNNIEHIIGNTNMEKLYLTANLKGLINTLNKYTNNNNIYNFIHNMDFIMKYISQENNSKYTTNIINKKLKEVNTFLLDTYIKKLLLDYNNSIITKNETNILLKEYLTTIPTAITLYDRYYYINSIDELITISKHIKAKEKKLIKN